MPFTFSEQHAVNLASRHLAPGEQLVARSRGVERPWWTLLMARMGALFWRNYLVVATNQRLLLIQHKGLLGGWGEKKVDSVGWHEIDKANLGWGVFNKDLTVSAAGRRLKKKITLGRFWMKNNFGSAESIVGTWQQVRASLPPAAAYPQMGPASGYPQQQQQQYGQAYGQPYGQQVPPGGYYPPQA